MSKACVNLTALCPFIAVCCEWKTCSHAGMARVCVNLLLSIAAGVMHHGDTWGTSAYRPWGSMPMAPAPQAARLPPHKAKDTYPFASTGQEASDPNTVHPTKMLPQVLVPLGVPVGSPTAHTAGLLVLLQLFSFKLGTAASTASGSSAW